MEMAFAEALFPCLSNVPRIFKLPECRIELSEPFLSQYYLLHTRCSTHPLQPILTFSSIRNPIHLPSRTLCPPNTHPQQVTQPNPYNPLPPSPNYPRSYSPSLTIAAPPPFHPQG